MKFALLLLSLFIVRANGADKSAQIDSLLSRYHELGLFNGSALVSDQGQVISKKGYGLANMEWAIANAPDTKFRLGSLTKQFTASLVLQLVEQGQVDLDAPITRYLSDYPKRTGDKITIHHLLNHTSGIPGYTEIPSWASQMREPFQPGQFIQLFSTLDLLFEPGTKFSYNNSGYFLLGVIIEKVTGKRYERVLRERILEPAGMRDTGYDSTRPLLVKRAAGYESTLDGYVNSDYIDMSQPYSAGSLYSTVEDLSRWDQALYGDKILSASSKERMFTPGLSNYGYGWDIHKGAVTTVEHSGGINGFNTVITRDLETKRLIVLLNNTGGAPLDAMATGIRAILDGHDAKTPKTPASPVLYKTYQKSGFKDVLAQLREFRSVAESQYDLSVGELGRLVRHLLSINKNDEALELAKTVVTGGPDSFEAAMLLAQANRANGNRVEAMKYYARAMELSDTPRAYLMLADSIKQLSNVEQPRK